MRKLGLRALAGGLAVMMVASVFAPAQKANAADVLLIAPAPTAAASETTLYVTEDMVDEDGEIVISGGNYDRVVVSKEAAAKDIYFDQVTVGELVVESGSNSKIQLWEVDAEKVTVQEPELEEITISDLLPLLADAKTQQAAIDLYMTNQAKNKKILNTAPSIVTKEDAKVDTVVVRANATLELKDGDVDAVALEASEKIERAKVTLKNFNGDVSYKGGKTTNSMTLKNVESRINKLTVEESGASNKLTVTAKDSVVLKAEIAGNAEVSLNAPMGTVEVTEAATAANVTVLGVADEMIVAANDAKVEVAPCGSIAAAQVTGDNVNVGGAGLLAEVDITGEGAYVSTMNTKVEGVNTYIPPKPYEPPKEVVTDIDLVGGEGAVVTKNADGSSTVVYTPTYKTATFMVPENVDPSMVAAVSIDVTYDGQFCVKFPGTTQEDTYPGSGTTTMTSGTLNYMFTSSRDKVTQIAFMCLEAPIEVTVKKITFVLLEEPREEEPLEVSAPKDLPENYLVYNVTDLEAGGYGYDPADAAYGGKTYTYKGQYQEVQYALPEALNVSDYSKMIVTMSYTSGEIAFKLLKEQEVDGEMKAVQLSDKSVWYGNKADDTKDIEVSLSGLTGTATHVGLMSGGPCDATVYRVAFVPKAGGGNNNQGGSSFAETKSYVATDLTYAVPSWNQGTTATANDDGSVTIAYAGNYHETRFQIPGEITAGQYEKIVVTASGSTINSGIELLDADGAVIAFWWGKSAVSEQDLELTYDTLGYSANGIMTEEQLAKKIAYVSFKNAVENQTGEITVHSIKFVGTEPEEGTIKEFYIAQDAAFTDKPVGDDGYGNINASVADVYLDSDNFKRMLPDALKADETIANKFTTLEGIIEMVDYFEVVVTLTEATAASEDIAGYAPQAQIYMQSSDWSAGTFGSVQGDVGQPSEGNPTTGTFIHSTSLIEAWTSPTVAKIGIQIFNALDGTTVSGTYSIKVVLK